MPRVTHLNTQDTLVYREAVLKERGIALKSQTEYFDRDRARWIKREEPLSDTVGKYLDATQPRPVQSAKPQDQMSTIAGFTPTATSKQDS
mmetsp:Transcript_13094/g.15810  ORF Transcript_13094/g.15810 Transcript_13094/m.15810 type:complete len:90 (+) Transcript_13094:235-504(+)